jgi:hypothetical protein
MNLLWGNLKPDRGHRYRTVTKIDTNFKRKYKFATFAERNKNVVRLIRDD